jgi:hypothetical protein
MKELEPEEQSKMHRWFGVEANNRAWDLIEKRERSVEETDEMLNTARASLYHWSFVGKPINFGRGHGTISMAHSEAGFGEVALREADKYLEYANGEGGEDWDVAFALLAKARANFALGNIAEGERLIAEAKKQGESIKEEEEKKVFLDFFAKFDS